MGPWGVGDAGVAPGREASEGVMAGDHHSGELAGLGQECRNAETSPVSWYQLTAHRKRFGVVGDITMPSTGVAGDHFGGSCGSSTSGTAPLFWVHLGPRHSTIPFPFMPSKKKKLL